MATANQIVEKAKSYLGVKESPANSNKCIFSKDYGVTGPRCMMYVWDIFRMCDASDLFYDGGKCASCTQLMNWAKKKGKFVTGNYKKGDVMFYNFNSDAKSEHTGICDVDNGTSIKAYEGNTCPDEKGSQANGGMVCYKTRKKSLILGAYRPDYEAEPAPSPKVVTPGPLPTNIVLKKGATGDNVKLLQADLNQIDKAGLSVDGDFGSKTETAVKNFQKEYNLEVDGSCGPKTIAMINAVLAGTAFRVQVTADSLRIRKGPGVSYAVVGTITDHGKYGIASKSGNWGKLTNGKGWICLDYTKKI